MNSNIILKDIKNCQVITGTPNYLLFDAKFIHSSPRSIINLSTYPEIKGCIVKATFFSEDFVLLEDSYRYYYLLSLYDGTIVFSHRTPKNRLLNKKRFAIAPNGRIAYDSWDVKGKEFLVKIDLSEHTLIKIPYKPNLNLIADILCLDENSLLILETGTDSINGESVVHNQITRVTVENGSITTNCIDNWDCPGKSGAYRFDGRYVLHHDMVVKDLFTGNSIDLLENTELQLAPDFRPLIRQYYPKQNYLQLCDLRQNIFIDCTTRRIIARYSTPGIGFVGAVIENEFWIGTNNGIEATAFPHIDEILSNNSAIQNKS